MKTYSILVLIAITLCGSCEKAKSLAAGVSKKPEPVPAAAPYSGPVVSEISQSSYDTFRGQRGRVVIIDFHAKWCGPCRQLGPVLEKIAAEKQGLVLIGKLDVDQNQELVGKENVSGIPDVRIYRDGNLVDKFVGMPPESEVRRRIENHLKGLPPVNRTAPGNATAPAGPIVKPMSKDWLPNGMKRR